PRAVMIENVRGLLEPSDKFASYRSQIEKKLRELGYQVIGWEVLEAKDFGVPQLRPRAILVALKDDIAPYFEPISVSEKPLTVLTALQKTMEERFFDKNAG